MLTTKSTDTQEMRRWHRIRGCMPVLCLWLLVASGCSADPEGAFATGDPAAVAEAGVAFFDDPAQMQGPISRAKRLIEHLGSQVHAIDALLLAFERGYDGPQVEAAVDDLSLQIDGSVLGASPNNAPLGRIALPDGASSSTRSKPLKRPSSRMGQEGKLIVEQLRGSVIEHGRADAATVTGLNGVNLILALLGQGFFPQEIIEIIILGTFFYESPPGFCFNQDLPLKAHEPVRRPCDGEAEEPATGEAPATAADNPAPANAAPKEAAVYGGEMQGFEASQVDIFVDLDGTITGSLSATEELENYVVSIDFGCGLFDEEEDCSGAVVECPATSIWSADLSPLVFSGDPPDSGTAAGEITVTWDTTPKGCGDPVTETQTFPIQATVLPDRVDVTAPLRFSLARINPPG